MRFIFLILSVCLYNCKQTQAQLCQGSLGDPIVNITFGAGTNPGAPLKSTANLSFFSIDCPNDGQYTIRNSTNQCFGNTWHTLAQDHTGDNSGYFMLINASLQQSEFYIDTVRGLCANTTYEFAAWVMNVILPYACFGSTIAPNLTFNIETTNGVVLQQYSTGSISASTIALWKQYGFFFKTPINTADVVLRIINNSQGGCGNDLAIDDITFRPCGPELVTQFDGATGSTYELCLQDSATVRMVGSPSAGYINPTYQWQSSSDGLTWTSIAGATTKNYKQFFPANTPKAKYYFRLQTAEAGNIQSPACRISSAPLVVNKHGRSSITTNSPVCTGQTLTLTSMGGSNYLWKNEAGFAASGASVSIANATPGNGGVYTVKVTDSTGCTTLDLTTVQVVTTPTAQVQPSSVSICQKSSVTLMATGGDNFRWYPATALSNPTVASPVATPDSTTTYTTIVSSSEGCSDTAYVTVVVRMIPEVSAGPDKELVEGEFIQLEGLTTGDRFVWSPATSINPLNSLTPLVSPHETTHYILTALSNNNCGSVSDTTLVTVYKKVIVPNAFSPNGDGVNDKWIITGLSAYTNYRLLVFNRYGQKMLETRNYLPWQGDSAGKPLPAGVYYYIIELNNALRPNLQGYIVLLK